MVSYPVWETPFSIYRKKFLRGQSPNAPDGLHLHMLIYKRLVRFGSGAVSIPDKIKRNSATSPYLWGLVAVFALPAMAFWHNTILLVGFCIGFIAVYSWLYWSIVTFRSPTWLVRRILVQERGAVESNA